MKSCVTALELVSISMVIPFQLAPFLTLPAQSGSGRALTKAGW